MALNRRRLELVFFGLYLTAAVVGMSMDAMAQILAH
jgi:hypothetical protein